MSVAIAPNLKLLPEGWRWVRTKDIGDVQLGRQRSPKDHYGEHMRPYLRVANVFEDRIDISDVLFMNFTPKEFERYRLLYGDILLNEGQSPELVGRPAMYRGELPDGCFQNTLIRFRPSQVVLPEFALMVFRAYLHSGQFARIAKRTVNIAHLGAERLAEMPFPLPPLPEQRRIAAMLTEQIAVVDKARAAVQAQLDAARALPFAILKSVFDKESPTWSSVLMEDVCSIQLGKMLSPKSKSGLQPRQYLRNANVQWGNVLMDDIYEMDFTPAEANKFALRPGDLLVCEGGEPGRCAVWTSGSEMFYQKALHRLRPLSGSTNPYFLMYRLWYASLKGEFQDQHTKTTIAHLPAVRLAKLRVSLPSRVEQDRFAEWIDAGFDHVHTLLTHFQDQLSLLETLQTSLLRNSLKGVGQSGY